MNFASNYRVDWIFRHILAMNDLEKSCCHGYSIGLTPWRQCVAWFTTKMRFASWLSWCMGGALNQVLQCFSVILFAGLKKVHSSTPFISQEMIWFMNNSNSSCGAYVRRPFGVRVHGEVFFVTWCHHWATWLVVTVSKAVIRVLAMWLLRSVTWFVFVQTC